MKSDILKTLQQTAEENILDLENLKAQGGHAVGFYCIYAPTELAVAAGAVPLTLCGTRHDPIDAAEEVLPRNLCPLIKSSYGFAATDTCPFFRFSDLIVADTTCDGKKKMFEIMEEIKPVHLLQLPQQQGNPLLDRVWEQEVEDLKQRLEELTGTPITPEKIRAAIELLNRERRAKKELMELGRLLPSPITGSELIEILFKVSFLADKEKGIELMQEISRECKEIWDAGEGDVSPSAPRILVSGVPMGLGSDKVVKILEQAGASVVAFENCTGYKQIFQVDETREPIPALAEQYLTIPCSVMSPNPGRMDLISEMTTLFSVDGVVDLTWQACHTYNLESKAIQDLVTGKLNLPYLHIETDYSEADSEQLRVRIEAFLEMI